MSEPRSTKAMLIEALYAWDSARARSLQKELGPSSLGSCRRQVFYKLNGASPVNGSEKLAAIMGTAIHGVIEEALALLPYSEHLHPELTVPGIEGLLGPGHIDLYQSDTYTITDWKTVKLKSLPYFPKKSQRWQVQTYGFLASQAGYRVDHVELVAIPRDGNAKQIHVHREEYDEAVAIEALDWLSETQLMDEPPPPEMPPYTFCQDYCPFYGPDLCLGK